jgi:hypothetical protein
MSKKSKSKKMSKKSNSKKMSKKKSTKKNCYFISGTTRDKVIFFEKEIDANSQEALKSKCLFKPLQYNSISRPLQKSTCLTFCKLKDMKQIIKEKEKLKKNKHRSNKKRTIKVKKHMNTNKGKKNSNKSKLKRKKGGGVFGIASRGYSDKAKEEENFIFHKKYLDEFLDRKYQVVRGNSLEIVNNLQNQVVNMGQIFNAFKNLQKNKARSKKGLFRETKRKTRKRLRQLYRKVKKQTDELDTTIYKELYKYYDEMEKSDTKGKINPYASSGVGAAGVAGVAGVGTMGAMGTMGTMGVMGTGVYPGTGMMSTPMVSSMGTGMMTPVVGSTMV